jgi:hypothetical protein
MGARNPACAQCPVPSDTAHRLGSSRYLTPFPPWHLQVVRHASGMEAAATLQTFLGHVSVSHDALRRAGYDSVVERAMQVWQGWGGGRPDPLIVPCDTCPDALVLSCLWARPFLQDLSPKDILPSDVHARRQLSYDGQLLAVRVSWLLVVCACALPFAFTPRQFGNCTLHKSSVRSRGTKLRGREGETVFTRTERAATARHGAVAACCRCVRQVVPLLHWLPVTPFMSPS